MAARRMNVLVVLGTRPEAIKLAPVISRLRLNRSSFRVRVCVTAQHRQMLDQALAIFRISPDLDMDVMRTDQDLFEISADVIMGMRRILLAEKPDAVVVQGDTTTAFAAALAAFYLRIPVAHVEAGLRTHEKYFPFPEEVNRCLLSVLADFHFAPTEGARRNLLSSGVAAGKIWVTGNTAIDALHMIRRRLRAPRSQKRWLEYFRKSFALELDDEPQRILLVTGHRRENFGRGLRQICLALQEIARLQPQLLVIYPLHLNPQVQQPVRSMLQGQTRIRLIEPLAYEPFVFLMERAYLILTDSGGIQEEAPTLGKPVLVMRRETERPEGLQAGGVRLVGTSRRAIVGRVLELLRDEGEYRRMARVTHPYGDGRAAQRIAAVLANVLEKP
jgi:UDP-N-acetylglucosamine 2-epimerase (non-hydrolysing)